MYKNSKHKWHMQMFSIRTVHNFLKATYENNLNSTYARISIISRVYIHIWKQACLQVQVSTTINVLSIIDNNRYLQFLYEI